MAILTPAMAFILLGKPPAIFVLLEITAAALVMWFWFGTYYVITTLYVEYHSGPINGRIPISLIKKIKSESNGWHPASALSHERIEIQYGKGKIVTLSPEDKKAFINAILYVNGEIKVE